MSRSVEEWIGVSDDASVPPRVKLRVFEKYNGVCYLSGRKITPADVWDCDHIRALANGGENRESNLAPVLRDKHREKTKVDVAEKSTTYQKRSKHLGIRTKRGFRKPPEGYKFNWSSGRMEKING